MGDEPFPQAWAEVAGGNAAMETFGFQPLIWGGLVTLFCASLPWGQPNPPTREDIAWCVAVGLAGLLLVAYEFWRRKHRTALLFHGDDVAIYRKGRLDLVIKRQEIGRYILQGGNTLQIMIGLGMFLVLACFGVLAGRDLGERLLASAGVLALGSAMASTVWTRIRCDYYLLPKKNGRNEMVLLRRQARALILS